MKEVSESLISPSAWRRYRKKTTIEAVQMKEEFSVWTLEGKMRGKAGDFLAKGIEGELYPIDSEIFFKTYEEIAPDLHVEKLRERLFAIMMISIVLVYFSIPLGVSISEKYAYVISFSAGVIGIASGLFLIFLLAVIKHGETNVQEG